MAYWHWLRFGPGFSRDLDDFQRRDPFNRPQWASWIDSQMRRLLQHAASQVPYYQRTWDERTKAAARAGRVEDLPLLDKLRVEAIIEWKNAELKKAYEIGLEQVKSGAASPLSSQ